MWWFVCKKENKSDGGITKEPKESIKTCSTYEDSQRGPLKENFVEMKSFRVKSTTLEKREQMEILIKTTLIGY